MTAPSRTSQKPRYAMLATLLLGLGAAGAAHGQLMNTNSTSFNAGYGRVAGEENRPVDFSLRNADGNLTIIDGVMNTGPDQSTLAGSSINDGGGFSGVGGVYNSSPSAIGNNLTVVTQGNYNTVIVNSVQTNNGTVSATGVINAGTSASAN
jgi:holdfast attachment protein HfaA